MAKLIAIDEGFSKRRKRKGAPENGGGAVRKSAAGGRQSAKIVGLRQAVSARAADPGAIVRKATAYIQSELDTRVNLHSFCPESIWRVEFEAEVLDKVVSNLCLYVSDAIGCALAKSTSHGGNAHGRSPYIAVELENAEVDRCRCTADGQTAHGRCVVLTVSGDCAGLVDGASCLPGDPTSSNPGDERLRATQALVRQRRGWFDVYAESGRHLAFRAFLPLCSES
jgi:hypothetical protein